MSVLKGFGTIDELYEYKAWMAWENMERCLKNDWSAPFGWFYQYPEEAKTWGEN